MAFGEKMTKISIISADDANEWSKFLSTEIEDLGNVNRYIVDKNFRIPWMEMNQDVTCIILSPGMLDSNKTFIQISKSYFRNPIIVLCGVPLKVIGEIDCCKPWRNCHILSVNSSEDSADKFYRTVTKKLLEQTTSNAMTLVPETIVQKANQSCVLLFSQAVMGQVELLIHGQQRKLATTKTDAKTYIFNVPKLAEGNYKINVFVSKQKISTNLSLTVINPKPSKCPCDFILEILDSNDFQPLDDVLRRAMENDYSNRLFYQRISEPNPDFPELPTALHFASKHGLYKVLEHLLEIPGCKVGAGIKNNEDKNCLDIAKGTKHSQTLTPVLQENCDDGMYIDLTQHTKKTQPFLRQTHAAYHLKG